MNRSSSLNIRSVTTKTIVILKKYCLCNICSHKTSLLKILKGLISNGQGWIFRTCYILSFSATRSSLLPIFQFATYVHPPIGTNPSGRSFRVVFFLLIGLHSMSLVRIHWNIKSFRTPPFFSLSLRTKTEDHIGLLGFNRQYD